MSILNYLREYLICEENTSLADGTTFANDVYKLVDDIKYRIDYYGEQEQARVDGEGSDYEYNFPKGGYDTHKLSDKTVHILYFGNELDDKYPPIRFTTEPRTRKAYYNQEQNYISFPFGDSADEIDMVISSIDDDDTIKETLVHEYIHWYDIKNSNGASGFQSSNNLNKSDEQIRKDKNITDWDKNTKTRIAYYNDNAEFNAHLLAFISKYSKFISNKRHKKRDMEDVIEELEDTEFYTYLTPKNKNRALSKIYSNMKMDDTRVMWNNLTYSKLDDMIQNAHPNMSDDKVDEIGRKLMMYVGDHKDDKEAYIDDKLNITFEDKD